MPVSSQLKILSVRLPEPEVRRFKTVAASRGVSIQEAVQEALEVWSSGTQHSLPEPLDDLEGSLADADVAAIMRQDKDAELQKDLRWQ